MTVKELEVELRSLQSQFVDLNSKIDLLLKIIKTLGKSIRRVNRKEEKQILRLRIVKKILRVLRIKDATSKKIILARDLFNVRSVIKVSG